MKKNIQHPTRARVRSALIWSARTSPRFGTGRHVAQLKSGDTSPHSKFRHGAHGGLGGCWMFPLAILFLFSALPLHGQTNLSATNAPLELLPPYGELPPTFWEQNSTVVSFAGIGVVALLAFFLWLLFHPKPKTIIPPEVQARAALENLRQQPEDGAVLSRVSEIVRHYFRAAFQLSPGELTTTEFCREISGNEKIGTELSTTTADFLRDCDNRKFSATAGAGKIYAANRALNLVEQAERRRAQLREISEAQINKPRA
jgi:hypothetical protein